MKKIMIITYSMGQGGSELNAYKITQILGDCTFDWYCLDMHKTDIRPIVESSSNINHIVNLDYKSFLNLNFLRGLSRSIREHNYTTVYAVGFMPSLLVALIKLIFRTEVRLVSTRREMMPWARPYHMPFIELVNFLSDGIETNSKSIYKDLIQGFLTKQKAYYISNITLPPATVSKMDTFDDNLVYVGTVANVREAKNIKLFLKIAKSMMEVNDRLRFVIAGRDSENLVGNFITENALQEKLTIFEEIKYPDINRFYMGLDLFLLTSTHEGSPNVLYEAISHGLPIVASDIPATRELIRHGHNGHLVDLDFPDDFVSTINSLFEDRDLLAEIQANNFGKALEICDLNAIDITLRSKFV